jgi:hypothetical protein
MMVDITKTWRGFTSISVVNPSQDQRKKSSADAGRRSRNALGLPHTITL